MHRKVKIRSQEDDSGNLNPSLSTNLWVGAHSHSLEVLRILVVVRHVEDLRVVDISVARILVAGAGVHSNQAVDHDVAGQTAPAFLVVEMNNLCLGLHLPLLETQPQLGLVIQQLRE